MVTFEPVIRLDVVGLTIVIVAVLVRYEVRHAVLAERVKRLWYHVFGEAVNRDL